MRVGGSGRRSMLLVLPVLLGVLGMHALVAPAAAPAASDGPATVAMHAPLPSAPEPAAPVAGEHGGEHGTPPGHGGHDDAAHLLHLCLAVLAAVGVAVLAARLLLGRLPLPVSAGPARGPARGRPAERPPPVPRRLARLCVLRN